MIAIDDHPFSIVNNSEFVSLPPVKFIKHLSHFIIACQYNNNINSFK